MLGAIAALLALESDMIVVGRAADGDEALGLVRALRPDILLTDVEMPGLSGLDAFARARAAGVRGYLLKDTPADTLAAAIRTVAAGGRAIPAALAAEVAEVGRDPLTERERATLRLAEEGLSNRRIAEWLGLSAGTVRNYLSDAAGKLGATNRVEAGRTARRMGWL